MAIGGHDQAAGGKRHQRAVMSLTQVLIVKGLGKQLVNQLGGCATTGAVGHVNVAALEVKRAQVVFFGAHAVVTGMS